MEISQGRKETTSSRVSFEVRRHFFEAPSRICLTSHWPEIGTCPFVDQYLARKIESLCLDKNKPGLPLELGVGLVAFL